MLSCVVSSASKLNEEELPHHAQSEHSAICGLFEPMIGPLTFRQRQEKVMKFILKKRVKTNAKKFTYECRKHVAEKRLRIKGRFVTKQ